MIDFSCIPYGFFEVDKSNNHHSIDKLVVDYMLFDRFSFQELCDSFASSSFFKFQSDREVDGYNSYFDKPPSSHYSWFRDSFWFPHCNVKHGLYRRNIVGKAWEVCEVVRVEFNPNKCMESDLFVVLQVILHRFCKVGKLVECDYAVDVPCSPGSIICQSRQTKVTYNDCRYYGKRHCNGRLKIYNKRRELLDKDKVDVGGELTRCEQTFRFAEDAVFSQLSFCYGCAERKLSSNLRSIADLIVLASSYGEDMQDLLFRYVKDKRNRDMLIPVLFGDSVQTVFNFALFYVLLCKYADNFNFWYHFTGVTGKTYNCPLERG